MFYIDTSAAMKLVVDEPESPALSRWVQTRLEYMIASDLLRTELVRATRRAVPTRLVRTRSVLESIDIMRLSTAVYERAGQIEPSPLRSLDALHLAAAMELGDELDGIVTYDERLVEAARANGIATVSPR